VVLTITLNRKVTHLSGIMVLSTLLKEVLFAVSNQDRLKILEEISKGSKRLTQCSKLINATNQECSRHLQRLHVQGLIEKDQMGYYEITPFGRLIMRCMRAIVIYCAS